MEGTLSAIDQKKMARIRGLPSYRSEMVAVEAGRPIAKTIDAVTACGNVNLVHTDSKQLDADYATFHEIVESGAPLLLAQLGVSHARLGAWGGRLGAWGGRLGA